MRNTSFNVGPRTIGPGHPCYIIAELSANHNQSRLRAIELIHAAKRAGADAIKLQTYTADTLTLDSDREWFQIASGLWKGRNLHDLYGEAFTPWEWHRELFATARELGLDCFSTPFDPSAVDLLEELDAPAYKVASFEVVDVGLLDYIGRTRKPVIMSTGMATLEEIGLAAETLRAAGAAALALLKCTSAYPAPPESMNLRTIPNLAETFGVVAGLSDHTLGGAVACAAVALGASIVEKHFTLARADQGPDSAFSMEPDEFERMVRDIRHVEQALGTVSYERTPEEKKSLAFRRSLFVVESMKAGDVFTTKNVRSIRPSAGLPPSDLGRVLGRRATTDIERGQPLAWELVGQ
jgi:pseudaminic acid synthase